MGMTNDSSICAKHDKIMELAQDAKTDGEDMEKKLKERREEVEVLNNRIDELEKENYDLNKRIEELEKELPPFPSQLCS